MNKISYKSDHIDPQVTHEELFEIEKQEVLNNKKSFIDYQSNMKQLIQKYSFKNPENSGSIPTEVIFNYKKYSLIKETHCATCDNPTCQKIFLWQDSLELGFSAFYYPDLPVFTCNFESEYCALCIGL